MTRALLLSLLLSACGGGGDATVVFTDPESPIVSPVENAPSREGAAEALTPNEHEPVSCHAPNASAAGIEHGRPPVGRCL
jgi:hypothetical protein